MFINCISRYHVHTSFFLYIYLPIQSEKITQRLHQISEMQMGLSILFVPCLLKVALMSLTSHLLFDLFDSYVNNNNPVIYLVLYYRELLSKHFFLLYNSLELTLSWFIITWHKFTDIVKYCW